MSTSSTKKACWCRPNSSTSTARRSSTAWVRSIRLQQALGLPRPAYAHLGLVTGSSGERLGKRDGALGLAALRAKGFPAPEVLGWLGWSLGCLDRPQACEARELVARFGWDRVPRGRVQVPTAFMA